MQINYSSFKQGDVVIAEIRFSNNEESKIRPALVISSTNYNQQSGDIVLLKITSKTKNWPFDVSLTQIDLTTGQLNMDSVIKSDFPVVIAKNRIIKTIATINGKKVQETKEKIKQVFQL